jgi:hypothetical protein
MFEPDQFFVRCLQLIEPAFSQNSVGIMIETAFQQINRYIQLLALRFSGSISLGVVFPGCGS